MTILPRCATDFISDNSYETPLDPRLHLFKVYQQDILIESSIFLFLQLALEISCERKQTIHIYIQYSKIIVLTILCVNVALHVEEERRVSLYLFIGDKPLKKWNRKINRRINIEAKISQNIIRHQRICK